MLKLCEWELMLVPIVGLHLGPDGYKVVFEELLRVIKGSSRCPITL
jgi:hypothetical protein